MSVLARYKWAKTKTLLQRPFRLGNTIACVALITVAIRTVGVVYEWLLAQAHDCTYRGRCWWC